MNFKLTVISGVVSTLIASFLTWLFGFWTTVWDLLTDAAASVWQALTYAAPVPISVLAALIICLMYLSNRLRLALTQEEGSVATSSASPLMRDQTEMSENELRVLNELAAADGRSLDIGQISSRIKKPHLVTEQVLEKLLSRKMLFESLNYIHGSSYRLSPEGRDYVIEQGIVK